MIESKTSIKRLRIKADESGLLKDWPPRITPRLSSLGASWKCCLFMAFRRPTILPNPLAFCVDYVDLLAYIWVAFLWSLQAMLHSGSGTQALCVLDVYRKLVQVASRQTPSRATTFPAFNGALQASKDVPPQVIVKTLQTTRHLWVQNALSGTRNPLPWSEQALSKTKMHWLVISGGGQADLVYIVMIVQGCERKFHNTHTNTHTTCLKKSAKCQL